MNRLVIYEIVYVLIVISVCLRIIYDTQNNTKTLAYLLLVIFLPLVGIFFYFFFGINYSKRKMYTKKLFKVVNRTMKELKCEVSRKRSAAITAFNRTMKELKSCYE